MKALILPKAAVGKSLLALLAISLFLGLAAGEAAAVTVSGAVKLDGAFKSGQTVVATTTSPNFCFLGEGVTTIPANPNAQTNYSFSLSSDQIVACGVKLNQDILVFVDVSDPSIIAALHDSIEKAFQFTGANITANFDLVTGVALSGDVTANSTDTTLNGPASGVTVFATNPAEGWKFIGQTTTDLVGHYQLFAPPGEGSVNSAVQLAVDASKITKYAGLSVDPPFIDLDITPPPNPTLINCSVTPCTGNGDLDFTLVDTLIVKGKVSAVDQPGGLSGALVEAFLVDPVKGWMWLDDDLTDAQGNYNLKVSFKLKNQTILLRVTHTGYVEKQVDVLLSPDSGTTNTVTVPNITLAKAVVVSGTVTDVTNGTPGTPVPNITVLALAADSTILALAQTDVNGFYRLELQPNIGNVLVHVVTAGTNFEPVADAVVPTNSGDQTAVNFPLRVATEVVTITRADWQNKTLTVWATDTRAGAALTVIARNVSGKIVVQSTPMTFNGTFYVLSQQVKSKLCGGTVVVSSNSGLSATSSISCP